MLRMLATLVLGAAILLPAASAFARDEGGADPGNFGTLGQVELNVAPAPPATVAPDDTSRE
ncbi:MAG TPA: hypothetical protein VFP86_01610 [bacterium]|nr:hypothetical protein [bacterium]